MGKLWRHTGRIKKKKEKKSNWSKIRRSDSKAPTKDFTAFVAI